MTSRVSQSIVVLGAIALTAGLAGAEAPEYDIYELQFTDAAHNWESLHAGDIVKCVDGIVTAKFKQRIVLQDPSLGSEWSAIEVRGYPVYPTGIQIGDQVDFDSVYVDEYAGATTLQYYSASSHIVHSTGNAIPEPTTVSLWSIRYPAHPEDCEKYAAMLISVDGPMTIGAMDLGKAGDNYELIGVDGDTAWASDYANSEIDSTYYVHPGECYSSMTGILQRYVNDPWDYYQLLPRGEADYVPCVGAAEAEPATPIDPVQLGPAFPNPFNPSAIIPFTLSRPSHVTLVIYDISGRRTRVLLDETRGPGAHEVLWNGADALGRPAPSGVYLMRLEAGGRVRTSKLCLLR